MGKRDKIAKSIAVNIELIKSEFDNQIKSLKKIKYSKMHKHEVSAEFAVEVVQVNSHIKYAILDEDYEFCALVRDYVELLKTSYLLDLKTYYTLDEEDVDQAEFIITETLK